MRQHVKAFSAWLLILAQFYGVPLRAVASVGCDDLEEKYFEGAEETLTGNEIDFAIFKGSLEKFRGMLERNESIDLSDPFLQSAPGKLALLEAATSAGKTSLLRLESILSQDPATAPRKIVKAQDKLYKLAERLSIGQGITITRRFPARLVFGVEGKLTPSKLTSLVEALYGISLRAGAIESTQRAVRKADASLFTIPFRYVASHYRASRDHVIRKRVEQIITQEVFADALLHLGLLKDPSLTDRWVAFRVKNANLINTLISTAVNFPFMWYFGLSYPVGTPKLDFVKSKRPDGTLVQDSRTKIADGETFEQHWARARDKYVAEYGYRPEINAVYSWSRFLYRMFLVGMVGAFLVQYGQYLYNTYIVVTVSDEERQDLENKTFDAVRVRDTLFAGWRRSFIALNGGKEPAPECDRWIANNIPESEKTRQDPAPFKARILAKLDADLKTPIAEIIKNCTKYIKTYIREFTRIYHEMTDDEVKLDINANKGK